MNVAKRQEGFTLIELLIAMAVFSFMLVIISVAFIGIIHITQAGTASRITQQSARLITEEIQRELRASQRVSTEIDSANGGRFGRLCLYSQGQYVQYAVDGSGGLRRGILPVSPGAACPAQSASTVNGWQKINENSTTVRRFVPTSLTTPGRDGGTATFELTMSGNGVNANELSADMKSCLPGQGSQFCSVTTLGTTAELRGGDER